MDIARGNNYTIDYVLFFCVEPDDDQIVSHDAPHLGLCYHCVVTSSFIPRSRDETMACFHTCLYPVASAFKSTDLVYMYIHYVSKENFAVAVKGFTCVSLVCREVQIRGKHMRTKKSSHPYSCCEFAC